MSSSGEIETKQKQDGNILQHINHVSPPPHRSSVAGTSPGQPTGANRGTHRPGTVAVARVGGEEPRLVQSLYTLTAYLSLHS